MTPLRIPRRLAIELLARAQQSGAVCGLVVARDGAPTRAQPLLPGIGAPNLAARGEAAWAAFHSHPGAAGAPSPAELAHLGHGDLPQLVMSLDTKGVLQLRCWQEHAGRLVERELLIAAD